MLSIKLNAVHALCRRINPHLPLHTHCSARLPTFAAECDSLMALGSRSSMLSFTEHLKDSLLVRPGVLHGLKSPQVASVAKPRSNRKMSHHRRPFTSHHHQYRHPVHQRPARQVIHEFAAWFIPSRVSTGLPTSKPSTSMHSASMPSMMRSPVTSCRTLPACLILQLGTD